MKRFNPAGWVPTPRYAEEAMASPAPLPSATIKPGCKYKFNLFFAACQP